MDRLEPAAILWEDHHLLVVNKPAPLLTQAPPNIPSLEQFVKAYIKEKYQKPAGVYLGVPHRLDRPVTGVIVFCRNTKAAQRVHLQFQERTVQKTYWARVAGVVMPSAGTWEDWLMKVPEESRTVPTQPETPGAKLATLAYRVLEHHADGTTLVELAPQTGRMHQLRAQAAWRGHPILGDVQYGSTAPFGPPVADPREQRIALHARQLEFTHPFTQERLVLIAPLPEDWQIRAAEFVRSEPEPR
ncbi:MAG: RluA family pseudouridine synthase [Gemmataceae bacterium]